MFLSLPRLGLTEKTSHEFYWVFTRPWKSSQEDEAPKKWPGVAFLLFRQRDDNSEKSGQDTEGFRVEAGSGEEVPKKRRVSLTSSLYGTLSPRFPGSPSGTERVPSTEKFYDLFQKRKAKVKVKMTSCLSCFLRVFQLKIFSMPRSHILG